jgi:hypothetical protein
MAEGWSESENQNQLRLSCIDEAFIRLSPKEFCWLPRLRRKIATAGAKLRRGI